MISDTTNEHMVGGEDGEGAGDGGMYASTMSSSMCAADDVSPPAGDADIDRRGVTTCSAPDAMRAGFRTPLLAVAIGLAVIAGIAVNPGSAGVPPSAQPGQLLQDGSFELRAASPWTAVRGGAARTGNGAALVSPSHRAIQDVPVAGTDGHSYRAEAWVRGPGTGRLVMTTRCPRPEAQATAIRPSTEWHLVSATLDTAHAAACSLGVRFESTSGTISVDDVAIVDETLRNGSFEGGVADWVATNSSDGRRSAAVSSVTDVSAPDGTHLARVSSSVANGSIRTAMTLDRSTEPFAAELRLLVRSSPVGGIGTVPVTVALWGRCPGYDENANVKVSAGRAWAPVTVKFRFSPAVERDLIRPSGDACFLQPEIYLEQAGTLVDVDAVRIDRTTVALRR